MMTIAESLIDFKRKDSKGKGQKVEYDINCRGDNGDASDNEEEYSQAKHKGYGKWRKNDKGKSSKAW